MVLFLSTEARDAVTRRLTGSTSEDELLTELHQRGPPHTHGDAYTHHRDAYKHNRDVYKHHRDAYKHQLESTGSINIGNVSSIDELYVQTLSNLMVNARKAGKSTKMYIAGAIAQFLGGSLLSLFLWYMLCYDRRRVDLTEVHEKSFKGDLTPVDWTCCPGCCGRGMTQGCNVCCEAWCCGVFIAWFVVGKVLRKPMITIVALEIVSILPLLILVITLPSDRDIELHQVFSPMYVVVKNLSIIVSLCVTILLVYIRMRLRTIGRHHQNLSCGDCCESCCCVVCCTPCQGAQAAAFIDAVERTDYFPEAKDGNELALW